MENEAAARLHDAAAEAHRTAARTGTPNDADRADDATNAAAEATEWEDDAADEHNAFALGTAEAAAVETDAVLRAARHEETALEHDAAAKALRARS